MKNKYLFGLVILVLLGGYFLYGYVNNSVLESVTGEVVEVDRSEIAFDGPTKITIQDENLVNHYIAVPSMGINLCEAKDSIADVFNVAIGDTVTVKGELNEEGVIVPCNGADDELIVYGKALDTAYEYEFSYRKGPDGYITLENNESTHPNFVSGLSLFNQKEYEDFIVSSLAQEAPASIRLKIYRNTDNLSSSVWLERNKDEVNANLMIGEVSEAVVGGANAVEFLTDGLYATRNYVVAYGSHVYVLSGEYTDTESQIYSDFEDLVSSFDFINPDNFNPQAKIDPRMACESALTYMTFESGEQADAFVEACVAGEYPEVIERYINDMGLDGATI